MKTFQEILEFSARDEIVSTYQKLQTFVVSIVSTSCLHRNPSSYSHRRDDAMHALVARHRGGCKCRSTCLKALRCVLIRHRVNEAVNLHPLPNEGSVEEKVVEERWRQGVREGSHHSEPSDLASLVKEFRAGKSSMSMSCVIQTSEKLLGTSNGII